MALKLLVIEDDEGVREMLELLLNYDDHELIFARDGSVLEELALMKPDMIFLDEWLCLEKGSDLCRKLKANPDTFDIPVILISAMMSLESLSKQAGADGYIRKPFDLEELNGVISRYT